MLTDQEALNPKVAFAKEVERIEGMPQTTRWRAIKELLFRVKPELRIVDKDYVEAIREERDFNMLSATGASKSLSTRRLYSMPQYMYATLSVIDPEFTRMSEDPEASAALHRKVAKVFPEYCLARKI